MKFTLILAVLSLLEVIHAAVPGSPPAQWYPLNQNGEIPMNFETFEYGQDVPLDCISRHIDNGEHKMDDQEKIIYGPFPECKETGKPLTFKYGVNEDINCTIGFTDELYHLFQLYIHQDAPFSCRVPISGEQNYIEKGGAFVPLTFNFRGEIHDSHLDIDSHLNVLFTKPSGHKSDENTIISSIAWSLGTNATRIVINDYMTINIAVRWVDNVKNSLSSAEQYNYPGIPFKDGFYKLPMNSIPMSYQMFYFYLTIVSLATGAIFFAFSYNLVSSKLSKSSYRNLDGEALFAKRD